MEVLEELTGVIVPIGICVVLPIWIVYIIANTRRKADQLRSKVLLKAIETGNNIDADKIAQALNKPKKSAKEISNSRLLCGCIGSLSGLFLIILGIVNYCSGVPVQRDPVTVPLVFGGIFLAFGISYLVVYFVTRKQLD